MLSAETSCIAAYERLKEAARRLNQLVAGRAPEPDMIPAMDEVLQANEQIALRPFQ